MNRSESVFDADALSSNKALADFLALIASYYRLQNDTYRAKSFSKASVAIANYPFVIISGAQAKSIEGVGDSIAIETDEFLNTGTSKRFIKLENELGDRKATLDYFRSFYGIGPVKAMELYNNGFRTVEEMWQFGNLTDAQKLGVMYREHINLRIPRAEMECIEELFEKLLQDYRWDMAGSYRRGEPESGDIDLLIENSGGITMESIIDLLKPILPATLAQGSTKYMGMIRLSDETNAHRIDIRLVEPNQYPAALMYFTGSQAFNILMRRRAIEFGMTLNEYGLFGGGAVYELRTEEEIFEMLRVRYMKPTERVRNLTFLEFFDL